MAVTNLTDRDDAGALIPEDVSREIIKSAPQQSTALSRFRQVRMSTKVSKQPVLSALPQAFWVGGDTGLKQTTEVGWKNKFLTAEEMAVIMPVPESVLDDSDYPIWDEAKPLIVEAFGNKLDQTVFFAQDVPTSFTDAGIAQKAIAAGNTFTRGTNAQNKGGISQDISDAFATVEEDGFPVEFALASTMMRGRVRGARNVNGDQLAEVNTDSWYGVPVDYGMRGGWPTGLDAVEAIFGDPTKAILGIRQDITFKVFTEGVISDDQGKVVLNLMQQDSAAIRVTFRVGFAVANPITPDRPTESARYPFGVLRAPAA
jgi:HK97 family phage major capsid protein